jgi:quercetin dioxygenase-like cupin family protein
VTSPSIASVHRIARALDLSIAQLFAEEPSPGRVVRRAARRRVEYPGLRAVDEFLTSNMAGRLQVILSTIEPGGGTGEEPYTHDSDEEVVVVLEGSVDLWVADEHYVLGAGDAITFPSRLPHWNMNRGETPAVVLFCLTPPSF